MILDYNTDPRGPHSLCCPIKYHPRANILGLKSGPDQPLTKWGISISSSSQSFLVFHHSEKKRLRAILYVQCVVLSLKYVTSVQQFVPVDIMNLWKKKQSTHTSSTNSIPGIEFPRFLPETLNIKGLFVTVIWYCLLGKSKVVLLEIQRETFPVFEMEEGGVKRRRDSLKLDSKAWNWMEETLFTSHILFPQHQGLAHCCAICLCCLGGEVYRWLI